ncbi:hypothetical protein KQI68_01050 [Peptoniphilus sp. MSJ-1]|uniref:Uncharacterized protein n=1 Tax=Peptoniphilus ovalis TaxID=2841503 RepID=A0ABS6FED5_9FIRM|nr:hypothetical protein [Peptoniphilus ovalis]MBU5668418.1 hypothetical protein [Peptoniphilus ovalis]
MNTVTRRDEAEILLASKNYLRLIEYPYYVKMTLSKYSSVNLSVKYKIAELKIKVSVDYKDDRQSKSAILHDK